MITINVTGNSNNSQKVNPPKANITTSPANNMITELILCLISKFSFSNSSLGNHKLIITPAYETKIVVKIGSIIIMIKLVIEIFKTDNSRIPQPKMNGVNNKTLNKAFALNTVFAEIGILRKIHNCLPSNEIETAVG